MGTRSLTEVRDGNNVLMTMYRQYDGYLSGHGAELLKKFGKVEIVNGISIGPDGKRPTKIANGLGCLAAQIVAHFKKEPGNFYLKTPGVRDVGEEYVYILTERGGKIWLEIYEGGVTFFGMSQTDVGRDEQRPEASKAIYSGLLSAFKPKVVEQQYHTA